MPRKSKRADEPKPQQDTPGEVKPEAGASKAGTAGKGETRPAGAKSPAGRGRKYAELESAKPKDRTVDKKEDLYNKDEEEETDDVEEAEEEDEEEEADDEKIEDEDEADEDWGDEV